MSRVQQPRGKKKKGAKERKKRTAKKGINGRFERDVTSFLGPGAGVHFLGEYMDVPDVAEGKKSLKRKGSQKGERRGTCLGGVIGGRGHNCYI